jgi:ABC-type transport system substrate-binding protein
VPLTIDLAYPAGYVPSATQAAVLHDDWGRAGVDLTIHAWSNAQFFAPESAGGIVMSGKFDVALYAQSTGPLFVNINGVYDCAGIPPHGFNAPRYCNRAVDALNDRYLRAFDPKARRYAAYAMQRLMNADTPGIVLYERTFLGAYDARLRGYHPNSFSYWGDPLDLDV